MVGIGGSGMNNVIRFTVCNPRLPFEILRVLTWDKRFWAYNHTPPEVLEELTRHSDWRIRWYVSMNPHVPVWLLEKLSGDVNSEVRCNVAGNTRTPVDILQKLSEDADPRVRYHAAWNRNLPNEARETLLKDTDLEVRYVVVARVMMGLS